MAEKFMQLYRFVTIYHHAMTPKIEPTKNEGCQKIPGELFLVNYVYNYLIT